MRNAITEDGLSTTAWKYEWAKLKCDEHDLYSTVADVLMSPSYGQLTATDLANWIVADKLPVRMQMQLQAQFSNIITSKSFPV